MKKGTKLYQLEATVDRARAHLARHLPGCQSPQDAHRLRERISGAGIPIIEAYAEPAFEVFSCTTPMAR
jgi:hypothetical protein